MKAMNVLIVHAHHEPRSLSSAMKDCMAERLRALGHTVDVRDLYAMKFDPVSDRRNFTSTKDPAYLNQHEEELHASSVGGFAPDIASELERVLRADLLIFNFPLWWFGMPAILKGWVDRVMAMGAIYGNGRYYENGIGRGKYALVALTTGGPPAAYGKWGVNPPLERVLAPIQHGIFWFLGYQPLPAFAIHGVRALTDAERRNKLDELDRYISGIDRVTPIGLPRLEHFESFAHEDRFGRFMVEVRHKRAPDDAYRALVPAEKARVGELERAGTLQFVAVAALDDPDWVGWLYLREPDVAGVEAVLRTLPLYDFLDFKIHATARAV
jgi:NAD(P)H dehydrogenase (quinone)